VHTKFDVYERELDALVADCGDPPAHLCGLLALVLVLACDEDWYAGADWGEEGGEGRPPLDDFLDDLGTAWKSALHELHGELALGHPERDPGGTASRAALDALLGAVTASLVRNYGRFVDDPASINLCHFRHGCGAAVPPDVSARTTHTKKKTACEEEDGALRRPGPSEEPARKKTKVGAATG